MCCCVFSLPDISYADDVHMYHPFLIFLSFIHHHLFNRCWNYYLTYCEAGFQDQSIGCLILTFSRPGNRNLLFHSETKYICSNLLKDSNQ